MLACLQMGRVTLDTFLPHWHLNCFVYKMGIIFPVFLHRDFVRIKMDNRKQELKGLVSDQEVGGTQVPLPGLVL